jgi:hypothetical protein
VVHPGTRCLAWMHDMTVARAYCRLLIISSRTHRCIGSTNGHVQMYLPHGSPMAPEGAWMVYAPGQGFTKHEGITTACSGTQKSIAYWDPTDHSELQSLPTTVPTPAPTISPTTGPPSLSPTAAPTVAPTGTPTVSPTPAPSATPTTGE